MNEYDAKFIKSASEESGFFVTDKPIICVCGKSNVGKSSFINCLAERKKLAKTSNTPGRTRLVNYFDFGRFVLADLPGYGYAEVSKTEKERWDKTLSRFFEKTHICRVFALVDIRHTPTSHDKTMIDYLYYNAIPFTLVATKADKLPKTKIKPQANAICSFFGLTANDIIVTSSETRLGRDKVVSEIDKALEVTLSDIGEESEQEV